MVGYSEAIFLRNPLGRKVAKSWKWLSSDYYQEVGECLRMCPLLPVCRLLGISLDENRASQELRLQLPDGAIPSSQFSEITPD
jgi:hypothetical protein